jgi:hypothetical protein
MRALSTVAHPRSRRRSTRPPFRSRSTLRIGSGPGCAPMALALRAVAVETTRRRHVRERTRVVAARVGATPGRAAASHSVAQSLGLRQMDRGAALGAVHRGSVLAKCAASAAALSDATPGPLDLIAVSGATARPRSPAACLYPSLLSRYPPHRCCCRRCPRARAAVLPGHPYAVAAALRLHGPHHALPAGL